MIVTTLKRTEKVNPLDQIKPVNKLDDVKDLDVNDSNMKQTIEEHKEALKEALKYGGKNRQSFRQTLFDYYNGDFFKISKNDLFNKFFDPCNIVLSPDEITTFRRLTTCYEDNSYVLNEDHEAFTGLFISNLIQNSYDVGYNNFNLGTNDSFLLGSSIEGSEENPIIIGIGEVEFNHQIVGLLAKHSTFNIKENHGTEIGCDAKHSTFNIEENQGENIGWDAKHSTFKSSNEKI